MRRNRQWGPYPVKTLNARRPILALLLLWSLTWGQTASAQLPAYAESIRQHVGAILNLQSAVPLRELSETPVERYASPNWWHTKGMLHSAMYRASVNGRPALIKTIFPDSRAFVGDAYFRQEVFAMVLASRLGGPELFRAGKIIDDDGRVGYFIEMEEMFPGEKDTFTFKGWGSKSAIERRLSFRAPSENQLAKIGQMIAANLERGIAIGVDNDFIFSRQTDDVRWLDTAEWILAGMESTSQPITKVFDYATTDFAAELSLNNYGFVITLFSRLNKKYGPVVLASLLRAVSQSKIWTDAQKHQLHANLRASLVGNWTWESSVFDAATKPADAATTSTKSCREAVEPNKSSLAK